MDAFEVPPPPLLEPGHDPDLGKHTSSFMNEVAISDIHDSTTLKRPVSYKYLDHHHQPKYTSDVPGSDC